jgi:hypothetical protein
MSLTARPGEGPQRLWSCLRNNQAQNTGICIEYIQEVITGMKAWSER